MCFKTVKSAFIFEFIIFIMILYITHLKAVPISTDEVVYLNSRLSYQRERFEHIRSQAIDTHHVQYLENLIARFNDALASDSNKMKRELLDTFMQNLLPDFADFQQLKLDEQYLNEEIAIEVWYLRQLMPQLADNLAQELKQSLPQYELARRAESLEDKYNIFTDKVASYSDELIAVFEAEPEHVAIVNAHLQFMRLFLNYLLEQNLNVRYVSKVKELISELEHSFNMDSYEHKLNVLECFDDLDSAFGRFLNYKINEFQTDTFSL